MEDLILIPGLGKSPGGWPGSLLQHSCLENPHGQKSLPGYSSWGHTKSDTTEATKQQQQQHNIYESLVEYMHVHDNKNTFKC